jgi:hypothetical protein
MRDWIGEAQDVYSIVRRNWLLTVMGPAYTEDYLLKVDQSRENYPDYYTRHDQIDNPKRHYTCPSKGARRR